MSNTLDKNHELDALLTRINEYLKVAEVSQPEPPSSRFPLILLVGAPRSGTTLFMQWLQATGHVAVPTNLLSRFYAAPAFGLMLQKLLTDARYQYRDELALPDHFQSGFGSEYGKTSGLLGHNSFFYFWRQFFPLRGSSPIDPANLDKVDANGFKRAINQIAAEVDTPVAMKAYLAQYNLRLIHRILGNVLFVHITRNPVETMRSLLEARKSILGDEGIWWGCRPPGSERLDGLEPAQQVAGQIAFTDRSIEVELEEIPSACSMQISYDALCQSPAEIWSALKCKVIELTPDCQAKAIMEHADYKGPERFTPSRKMDLQEISYLRMAWETVSRL